MLHQNNFSYAHFPELVDLAVIGTGLGLVRANVALVNNKGSYWDTTHWLAMPKPFLGAQSFAYAMAIAAWSRGEQDPQWSNDLPAEIKAPMKKSLKYLNKTNDSFFQPETAADQTLSQSQDDWWKLARSKSSSTQVVALHQLQIEGPLDGSQQNLLVDQLRSNNRAILLHSIGAVEQMQEINEPIVDELRLLAEHRDNEVRAKAMCALTRLAQLDEATTRLAANMLDSKTRFVTYAGILASGIERIRFVLDHAVDRSWLPAITAKLRLRIHGAVCGRLSALDRRSESSLRKVIGKRQPRVSGDGVRSTGKRSRAIGRARLTAIGHVGI